MRKFNSKYTFYIVVIAIVIFYFIYRYIKNPYKPINPKDIKYFTPQELEDLSSMMYSAQGYVNDDEETELIVLNAIKQKSDPKRAFDELSNYYYFKYKRNLKSDFLNSLSTSELQPFTSFLF